MTWFIRRVARRLSLIEQVLPENPRPPCFSGVRAAQSLIFFAMFWWSFCLFSIGHCIVCLCFFEFSLLITPLVSSNCSYDDLWCDPIPRILGSWMHNMFVDDIKMAEMPTMKTKEKVRSYLILDANKKCMYK
jgi:hypothetical protein